MTSSPRRSTTRTRGSRRARRSRRPRARPARRPGPATEPKAGRRRRRCPAGATTSVFERERALHGLRLGAVGERGERLGHPDERDPHRVVRVAVAVRVDGAVEPRDQLVAAARRRARGRPRRPASRRRGSAARVAPGATPCRPPGPPAPTSMPASSVPCRSICAGSCGFARAVASRLGRRRRSRAATRPPRYGCVASTPVSSSAIVTPRPSKPGSADSGRWPLGSPNARGDRAARPRSSPGTRPAPGRRRRPRGCARAATTARGSSARREAVEHARSSCSRAGRRARARRA